MDSLAMYSRDQLTARIFYQSDFGIGGGIGEPERDIFTALGVTDDMPFSYDTAREAVAVTLAGFPIPRHSTPDSLSEPQQVAYAACTFLQSRIEIKRLKPVKHRHAHSVFTAFFAVAFPDTPIKASLKDFREGGERLYEYRDAWTGEVLYYRYEVSGDCATFYFTVTYR